MTWILCDHVEETEFCLMNNMRGKNCSTVLCIIDFSESSRHALKWAAGMARMLSAHITVVHPYRLNQVVKKEDMISAKKNTDRDAVKNFENIAADLFKNENISYNFQSEVGFIQDRVEEYISKSDILFVAISKHQISDNKETIHEMLGRIEVPLVIVPA
jgi:stalled ribosome rescue protein Dom34